jgi:hypothetical protein
MSKDEVISKIGDPDSTVAGTEREILEYELRDGNWERAKYLVVFKDNKVQSFGHVDAVFPPSEEERNRRAQRAAQAMQMMQMMQQRPNQQFKPVQPYQAPRPTQTNCQGRWVGGTFYNDCSSQKTGVDSSIYGN